MPKCDFNKVVLQVFVALLCCFSEHLFLRTPLDGCFCCGELVLRGVVPILGNGQKQPPEVFYKKRYS